MIKSIMQRNNIDVSTEYIRETWHPLYRRHFLKQSLARAYDCRKSYYLYHQGLESEVRHICYSDLWFYYVGHLESKERLRIQPAQLFHFS